MSSRVTDWMRQAERDLEVARTTRANGQFDWSCFAAQQAAEKVLKSLYQFHNAEGLGHVLDRLVEGLLVDEPGLEAHRESAKILDKFFIPTRYPNGLDSGAPADAYTETEADLAIDRAVKIIEFCQTRCRAG